MLLKSVYFYNFNTKRFLAENISFFNGKTFFRVKYQQVISLSIFKHLMHANLKYRHFHFLHLFQFYFIFVSFVLLHGFNLTLTFYEDVKFTIGCRFYSPRQLKLFNSIVLFGIVWCWAPATKKHWKIRFNCKIYYQTQKCRSDSEILSLKQ